MVFGRTSFPATLDVATLNGSNGFAVNAAASGDALGTSGQVAGDINGDGVDDIVISAGFIDRTSGGKRRGGAYVIFGKRTATAGPFLANLALSSLNGSNGFVIRGVSPGDNLWLCHRSRRRQRRRLRRLDPR